MATDKNPVMVAAGLRGARKRWGEPRIVRLDSLSPEWRRLVLAILDAAKANEKPAPSGMVDAPGGPLAEGYADGPAHPSPTS